MTELKTLKDFKYINFVRDDEFLIRNIDYRDLCSREELKAEAVKWVKEIQEKDPKNVKDWGSFIAFFNLTEEDLK